MNYEKLQEIDRRRCYYAEPLEVNGDDVNEGPPAEISSLSEDEFVFWSHEYNHSVHRCRARLIPPSVEGRLGITERTKCTFPVLRVPPAGFNRWHNREKHPWFKR